MSANPSLSLRQKYTFTNQLNYNLTQQDWQDIGNLAESVDYNKNGKLDRGEFYDFAKVFFDEADRRIE